jgi:coatomer subunit beta'
LATESFTHSKDLGSLLLLHSSTGNRTGLENLNKLAVEVGAYNVAFNCRWLLGDVDGCIDALTKTGRLTEAAFFAQTYKPSAAPAVVADWKQSLEKAKKGRVAKMIAVPGEDDELFPAWDEWLQLEKEGGSADPATLAAAAAGDTNGATEEEAEAADEDEPTADAEEEEEE